MHATIWKILVLYYIFNIFLSVQVWDRRLVNVSNPSPVGILAGHRDGITYIDSRGDTRYLITNSKDQCIKLWDTRVFSSCKARQLTERQDWDYRWQPVPQRCKYLYKQKKMEEKSLRQLLFLLLNYSDTSEMFKVTIDPYCYI